MVQEVLVLWRTKILRVEVGLINRFEALEHLIFSVFANTTIKIFNIRISDIYSFPDKGLRL